jgi:hypothetical protein
MLGIIKHGMRQIPSMTLSGSLLILHVACRLLRVLHALLEILQANPLLIKLPTNL